MAIKIWVGKRESDILTYQYFDVSITFWGSNTNNNHSFCSSNRVKANYNKKFTEFVKDLLIKYISLDKNTEIHFYNNEFAYKLMNLEPLLEKYIVNINSKRILDITHHKTLSRVWLQNTIDVPDFACLSKSECHYQQLIRKYPSYDKFIIQKNMSGGGEGTYLIDNHNCEIILSNLAANDIYLISPYYENNISLSCHLLIDNKKVTVFPISQQLLNYDNNKIAYCGNKYLDNNNELAIQVKNKAINVGKRLMEINYRGICGLDFIFIQNNILLIEINPRYQGSSYLLNAVLNVYNLPSLFELNSICFSANYINNDITSQIDKMSVSFESYTSIYKLGGCNDIKNLPKNVLLFLDGLSNANKFEDGVYLYRYLKSEPK